MTTQDFGSLMRRESMEAASVLLEALQHTPDVSRLPNPERVKAIYTIARGSSDAAATVLNYEFMRQLGVPATTLPPSVFSLGTGVSFDDAMAVTISQSGASDDLVIATKGAAERGAAVVAITNVDGSPVEQVAHSRLPILAGPELAVPATKSVVGALAAGAALIGAYRPDFATQIHAFAQNCSALDLNAAQFDPQLSDTLAQAKHVFVVGRQEMFGAAQEIALKIKECCAIHAEAYSASEVLHGPMQLAGPNLVTLLLDDGSDHVQSSLDLAETHLTRAKSKVVRLRLSTAHPAPQSVVAAVFLIQLYPIILATALQLGLNPDAPDALAKVTQTV